MIPENVRFPVDSLSNYDTLEGLLSNRSKFEDLQTEANEKRGYTDDSITEVVQGRFDGVLSELLLMGNRNFGGGERERAR